MGSYPVRMELDLRHLRYFVAVAEEGGFTRAAARLHMTQPPLSVAIRQLEGELGLQLLDRTGNRVELTSAGREFLNRAKGLLQQWQRTVDGMRQVGWQELQRLVIAFRPAVCHPLAHRTIELIREKNPQCRVLPRYVQWTDQTACLEAGDADVSFVLEPADHTGLESATVAMLPRVVCLPSAHELASRESVSIDDLSEVPIIRPAGGSPNGPNSGVGRCAQAIAPGRNIRRQRASTRPSTSWPLRTRPHSSPPLSSQSSTVRTSSSYL